MLLRGVSAAVTAALMLAWGGPSMAEEYRPDQYLGLNLSTAVLSQKRLGPPTHFAPVPIEDQADRAADPQARVEPSPSAKKVVTQTVRAPQPTQEASQSASRHVSEQTQARRENRQAARQEKSHGPRHRISQARAHPERPHGLARTKLAHRHGNPLNAQAMDTRVQVWPCKSGGICNWKR